jgi:hypothetical protein
MTGTEKRDWKGYTLVLVRKFGFFFLCLIGDVFLAIHLPLSCWTIGRGYSD